MAHVHGCTVVQLLLLLLVVYGELMMNCMAAIDYCSRSLCVSAKHIACDHNGAFAASCPSDAELVAITPTDRRTILNAHNEIRNRVAGGDEGALTKACRMPTMQWDSELAQLADLNVKQCRLNHDACRKTDKYHWAGQNLAWISYRNPLNVTEMLEKAVALWYSEASDVKMEYINEYPNGYEGPTIGHFTVMVADKNTHLGCGAVTYTDPNKSYKVFLLACNHATTNIISLPIYRSCSRAGQNCVMGTDGVFKNLCKKTEPIDPNVL